MQFSHVFISALLVGLSPFAAAAPSPDLHTMAKRQGWTCAFAPSPITGAQACQIKCLALKKWKGGYCNSQNVCVCR